MNVQWTSELDINMDTVRLLKLLAPVMTIAHYVGCFWYYMSAQHPAAEAWWGNIHFDNPDSIISKYIASVYWATTTMTTVGFGDVIAINNYEQAYSILVMIGGTTLFAYVVGTVIEVVSNSKSLMNREHEMVQKVNAYIKERGVSNEFIVACQEHLRFLNTEKTLFREPELFDALCYGLRSELILYLNNGVLSKIRFFDKKPKWFLTLILPRLVPQYFLAGDLLIYHGNPVSGIFFLMTGAVIIKAPQQTDPASELNGGSSEPLQGFSRTSDRDGTIAMLYEGEFFGYKEVLTQSLAQYNAFAVKPTGTYMLPREFLETFQADYPFVMDEMKAMIMHSIHKQQTIVHHWQNNDAIGMFGRERENFLKQSNRNQFKDTVLPDVAEAMNEEDADPHDAAPEDSGVSPSGGADTDPSHHFESVNNPQYDSFVSSLSPRTRSQEKVVMTLESDESDHLSVSSNECEPSALSFGPPLDAVEHPPPGIAPHHDDHRAAGSVKFKEKAIFLLRSQQVLRHHGSASSLRSNQLQKQPTGARRGSVIGISMAHSGGDAPALKRYPSNPAEVDAIVERLLLVEGYQVPRVTDK
ncbi:Potassium/sodium hyperpolarization-activated cyclic nucleotide-gated channel, partial [Globisporangium splendens]